MKRQPAKYVLSDEVLGKSLYGDPTLLLVWARDPVRRRPPTGKGMCDAGEELLRCGVRKLVIELFSSKQTDLLNGTQSSLLESLLAKIDFDFPG
jgi:hypothetical protein